jgi:hypothetical protein
MVKKERKVNKKGKKNEEDKDEHEGGASLDDAFAGDEDVEYAQSKPRKEKKKKDLDEELDDVEEEVESISKKINGDSDEPVKIKASKSIGKIKKGDRINVDGKEYSVDGHYVLIDHGTTKEMAIELFDKGDKDYQLRYFNDQVETTLQFYELQEIIYVKKPMKEIEW